MSSVEIKQENFTLESIEEKDGKFYVIGRALSQDFECEHGLEALAEDVIRSPLVWRHRHPIENKHKLNHIYGRVLESWVDEFLMVKAEIYDHTEDHLALRDVIRERAKIDEPLSFSMHYRTYFNEDRTTKIHWDVFELSGTPYPACKTCQIENFIGENEMVKDETEKPDLKELEAAVGKIQVLEGKLNAKTKVLEDLQGKLDGIEKEKEIKDQELENAKKATLTSEDRILELESSIDELKNKTVYLETKKPVITEILKHKKLDDRELEFYKGQDVAYLNGKLEEAKKDAENKIVTQGLEAGAEEARKADGSEDNELEEPEMDVFMQHLGKKITKE